MSCGLDCVSSTAVCQLNDAEHGKVQYFYYLKTKEHQILRYNTEHGFVHNAKELRGQRAHVE